MNLYKIHSSKCCGGTILNIQNVMRSWNVPVASTNKAGDISVRTGVSVVPNPTILQKGGHEEMEGVGKLSRHKNERLWCGRRAES